MLRPESQEEVTEAGPLRYLPPMVEVIGTLAELTMGKVPGTRDGFGGGSV